MKTTVYIVRLIECEEQIIAGIFSTLEKANDFMLKYFDDNRFVVRLQFCDLDAIYMNGYYDAPNFDYSCYTSDVFNATELNFMSNEENKRVIEWAQKPYTGKGWNYKK